VTATGSRAIRITHSRIIAYRVRLGHTVASADSLTRGTSHMKWETPAAIELRLGMEINSYVSVR